MELGVELKKLEDRGKQVEVTLVHHKQSDSPEERHEELETAYFEYVIGADGAKGIVWKQLGLSFVGNTSPKNFIVGDLVVEGLSTEVQFIIKFIIPMLLI